MGHGRIIWVGDGKEEKRRWGRGDGREKVPDAHERIGGELVFDTGGHREPTSGHFPLRPGQLLCHTRITGLHEMSELQVFHGVFMPTIDALCKRVRPCGMARCGISILKSGLL